jgi:hypothetical protein
VASTPDTPGLDEAKAATAADRFDIRRLIGALFAIYGLILTILGIIGSTHVKHKAAGINVDLWTGLGMLVFAGLMVFWALARPASRQFGSQATPGRRGEQAST